MTGIVGAPHLYVLSHCRHWVYEIEHYKWKKARPGQTVSDEPEDRHDHHMDGMNGFVTGRPEAGVRRVEEREDEPAWLADYHTLFSPRSTASSYMGT